MTLLAIVAATVVAAVAFALSRRRPLPAAPADDSAARREAEAIRIIGESAALAAKRQAEFDARSAAQDERAQVDTEARSVDDELSGRSLDAERRTLEIERRAGKLAARVEAVASREQILKERDAAVRALRAEAEQTTRSERGELERIAGETGAELQGRLTNEWLEQARAGAAERLRRVEASVNDPEHGHTAKRIMTIAVQRYQGHYLTERLLTNVPVPVGALARITGEGEQNLRVIEEVSHVNLLLSETGDAIRLDGQDSFGREIARRAIHRFGKNGVKGDGEAKRQCEAIAAELDREVMDLGKKAFKELDIPRSHPDIVKLVGKLNYRTSYTQNQWKHAVEAAFLCGMMADELGLDVKLARRAGLMHDIGKALTHEIDGSHAVIGADLARKLGEDEVVANAIGAHHTDEPFNTAYAYLVAASDAMSGARPGARRQQDDNYAERLADLERIASSYQGVDRVYAVHGGREVRIHVLENRVSDERAVAMSSEIALKISDEMTFPGQIKVTIIREVRATAVAN
ncbi:MAG: DUF3552 domain-containing protein [Myxococcales bacterium]|nr:DUF3552 domain-containing protein [Myxococcales bacterium]